MATGDSDQTDPFALPRRTAALLAGFPRPWWVAGGWAVDLFLGRVSRPHKDIEIAVLRADQHALRGHLSGWTFTKIVPRPEGGLVAPLADGEWLAPPLHQMYARRSLGAPAEIEALLNEAEGDRWRFRRNPAITRPLARVGGIAACGAPFLAPEIVLLYKAKTPRPEDEADFALLAPELDAERRAWLREALEVFQAGHPWRARL